MKLYRTTKVVNPGQLNDELSATPGLGPVAGTASFFLSYRPAASEVVIGYPDSVDEGVVAAVVAAHVPGAVTPPPDTTRPPALPQAIRDKLAPGGGTFTNAEQMVYNRWVYLVLRWLAKQATGQAE